jgi:hypothetical protein
VRADRHARRLRSRGSRGPGEPRNGDDDIFDFDFIFIFIFVFDVEQQRHSHNATLHNSRGVPMRMRISCLVAIGCVALIMMTRTAHADEPPPPPAPAEDKPAVAPAQEKPKWQTPIGLRLDGGWSPRKLLAIPVSGADIGAAFGAQPSEHAAFWGSSRVFIGSTENGLKVFSVRFGGDIEAVIDRFRIGGGLNLFVVGVGRAVRNETIYSWGPAVHAATRFDVIQSEGFAIFARAGIDAGLEIYNSSIFWGPSLGGGVDFDLAGGKRTNVPAKNAD